MAKTVVAVLSDLMFTVKILDAAKKVGLQVVCVKTSELALAKAAEGVAGAILDLAFAPVDLVAKLKTAGVAPVIGYAPHVEAQLIQQARDNGCDQVLARSGFVANLDAILASMAG